MSRHIFITVFIAVAASLLTYTLVGKPAATSVTAAKEESAFERVTRTNTLRCGWATWPPSFITKDPNTGKVTGALVDLMEKMGQNLKLKIEWGEETGWGAWVEGLRSHRFDVFCSTSWQKADYARDIRFGKPIFYDAVYGYARADDHRFDNDLQLANNPAVKIAGVDGEISQLVARDFFPKATSVSMPEMTDPTQTLMNVTSKKADLVFNEPFFVESYIAKNPNSLRRITKSPIQVYNSSFATAMNEDELMQMLDTALIELENTGVVDQILSKHGLSRELVPRPAMPYQQGK